MHQRVFVGCRRSAWIDVAVAVGWPGLAKKEQTRPCLLLVVCCFVMSSCSFSASKDGAEWTAVREEHPSLLSLRRSVAGRLECCYGRDVSAKPNQPNAEAA